jgi:hypothetical protein
MASSTIKIYAIMVDFTGTPWLEACKKTAALEKDIALLAKKTGAVIYFHQYKENVLGGPVVLLECSESFLEKVKKLPLFDSCANAEGRNGVQNTIRRDALQSRPKNSSPKP